MCLDKTVSVSSVCYKSHNLL